MYDKLLKSMSDIQALVPTNDELRAIIEKIGEFLKKFVKLFDALKAGFAQVFYGYESIYSGTDAE